MRTAHTQPLETTAIAGVDWPSGVPGFFPVGWSIMGRWTAVFFYFCLSIYVFILSAAPCLGNYDNSPGPGRETCIGLAQNAWHHVIATHHDWQASRWLDKLSFPPPIPATQLYLTNPPRAISFTKTGPVAILDSCFFFFFPPLSLPSWAPVQLQRLHRWYLRHWPLYY